MEEVVNNQIIEKIFIVREVKVMIDSDLAQLYGVETKYLKRQVKRNIERFPDDFMFYLTKEEQTGLRCQVGTLKRGTHSKYLPMAFTEQGVAQLSGVLNSKRAIEVNIQIIRMFTKMRMLLMNHKDLILKLEKMELNLENHGKEITVLFRYIKKLIQHNSKVEKQKNRNRIGYK